jgi:ketosteroid isomerase-like protein
VHCPRVQHGRCFRQTKDIPTLERYYADDVTDVGADGTMSMKSQDISSRYRFTDTFVKRNGQWQCVATQTTKIVEQQ